LTQRGVRLALDSAHIAADLAPSTGLRRIHTVSWFDDPEQTRRR
jgi:hypothetical protein